jgi:hypothetical protein
VASKDVGFHIFNLKMFACDQYKLFFHMFGNGGAHWISEYKKFIQEEDNEWTVKARVHQQQANRSAGNPLSGANRIPLGHHQRVARKTLFSKHRFH